MTSRRDPTLQESHEPAPAKVGAGRVFGSVSGGCRAGLGALLAATAGALAVASGAGAGVPDGIGALSYQDGPPPGFSGGFGEDTCQGCHFEPGLDVNDPAGSLALAGVPERFEPGKAYAITVTLGREGIRVGGFMLTARFEDGGAQAGELSPPEGAEKTMGVTTDRGVQYAHQRLAGSALAAPDTARWTVVWTAPAKRGAVVFNVAANAGNGDDSAAGDYVYAAEAKVFGGGRW